MKQITFWFALLCAMMMCSWAFADSLTVATGKTDGGYHNRFFNRMNTLSARLGGEDDIIEFEYYSEKGTDGSAMNVKLVNSGKADVGITQLGATVINDAEGITAFGPIAYELAHYVYQKGSKIKSCGKLQKKGVNLGINTMSGSMVTLEVMGKVDSGYKKATPVDTTRGSIAMTKMNKGAINGYFFVSIPRTKNITRFAGKNDIVFGSCWDSNFDDFKVNDKPLYTKVSFSKKEAKRMGYSNKFKTFRVPAYLVVNNKVLAENEDLYDLFTDLSSAMYSQFAADKGSADFYPSR